MASSEFAGAVLPVGCGGGHRPHAEVKASRNGPKSSVFVALQFFDVADRCHSLLAP